MIVELKAATLIKILLLLYQPTTTFFYLHKRKKMDWVV